MKIIPVINLCFGTTTWLWYTNRSICYSEGLHFMGTSEIQLPREISLKIVDLCFSETRVSTYKDLLFLTSFPPFFCIAWCLIQNKTQLIYAQFDICRFMISDILGCTNLATKVTAIGTIDWKNACVLSVLRIEIQFWQVIVLNFKVYPIHTALSSIIWHETRFYDIHSALRSWFNDFFSACLRIPHHPSQTTT